MAHPTISLLGATYSNVPAVELPVSGGGTASFTDVTDTTATASDVLAGKYFYLADGTFTEGTGTGGGGGSSMQVGTVTAYSTNEFTLTFAVSGEPTSFSMVNTSTINTSSAVVVASAVYDGTSTHGQGITNTSNAITYLGSGYLSYSYNNGAVTVYAEDCEFASNPYYVIYTYGGTAGNISTSDVQVGSGATTITFTGLSDEPECWSCIFKSNFGTSSGYQRVIAVEYDGTYIIGMEMDSAAKFSSAHWTASYNNGSLTITSSGTNAGGYFHQPGYYQLTYGVGGDQTLQTKTVTPTTSTQNVTADTAQGYTALKKVVVNPIPSSYVQPTTTVGATTYRASTSSQTIQSGTYHSAAATIAAVSQTNLSAENIKSGTTISISNGQSNLWSVTGTYSGGGGGDSKNAQVVQQGNTRITSTTYSKACGDITVSKTGTYDVYWSAYRTSTSGTWGTQLYIGSTAYGSAQTTFSSYYQTVHLSNVSLTANQTISVYGRSRGSNYYLYVGQLTIIEA